MIVHIFTLELKKHTVLDSNLRRRGHKDRSLPAHLLRFLHDHVSGRYVSIRTNKRLEKHYETTKEAPTAGGRREYGLGRYPQGREGRARRGTSSN